MEPLLSTLAVLAILMLRIGVPMGVTAVIVVALRKLDDRWQKEASEGLALQLEPAGPRCWEVRGCPPERRSQCPAYNHPDTPCWQAFRDERGHLREVCLGCDLFRQAPLPVVV